MDRLFFPMIRILKWQRKEEDSRDVEEPSLEFEEWPHMALVKTYCRSMRPKDQRK